MNDQPETTAKISPLDELARIRTLSDHMKFDALLDLLQSMIESEGSANEQA